MQISNAHNSTRSSDLMGAAWDAQLQQTAINDADREHASATLSGVKEIVGKHFDQDAEIKGDGDLSEDGKKSRRSALIQRSDEKLNALTNNSINELKSRAANLQAAVSNSVSLEPTLNQTHEMIHRREIASSMIDLVLYQKLEQLAHDGGDDLSLHAVLTASQLAPLITSEQAAHLRDLMAVRINPNKNDELNRVQNHLALLQSVKATAHRQLASDQERRFLGAPSVPA